MIYSTVAPCKKKKGFEGHPDEFFNISLPQLNEVLSKSLPNYEILRKTSIMMMLVDKISGHKISIFPSARVFIHGSLDEEEAKKILLIISRAVIEISEKNSC
ncbi:MAG: hypothetical protein KGD64_09985 [Candidatus Heimdallarchaeota archaeon]|nr:hypothetical protein [Candidatus Heimdallarchaeota archaeon]